MGEDCNWIGLCWRNPSGGVGCGVSGRWPRNLRHLANPSEDDPIPTSGDPLTASKLLGFKESSSGDIHRKILAGFPYRAFGKLQDAFAEQQQDLPALLEFPARTLARRKATGTLSAVESEAVFRIASLVALASELFGGNRATAIQWLNKPARSLSGETPMMRARTEVGGRDVEQLIGRLRHGVFS